VASGFQLPCSPPRTFAGSKEAHSSTVLRGTIQITSECCTKDCYCTLVHYWSRQNNVYTCCRDLNTMYILAAGSCKPMEKSAAASEHLRTVEIKCEALDERVLNVLKFLVNLRYRWSLCWFHGGTKRNSLIFGS
jgi:hypothetical protein